MSIRRISTQVSALACLLVLLMGCDRAATTGVAEDDRAAVCDPDNGGITLPDGFCATVVADSLGRARHLVVSDAGVIYVAIGGGEGAIVALRDTTGDYRADVIERFGEGGGTGIDVRDGYLYFASDTSVVRYALPAEGLVPAGPPEIIARGFEAVRQHAAKPFALDGNGGLYVNVGAPSNACQDPDRTPGVPGQDPCPLLERFGGIWRFDAATPGQDQQADGHRYATGIRNAVALDWNDAAGGLYALQHGRDQLNQLWPERFDEAQNAELPSEEFFKVDDGDDFGWPYCYYDAEQQKKVLGPEYGGDGREVGRCDQYEDPIVAFPGHWAPNDLLFYTGDQFPGAYQGGAFIAFHGSWNRAPLPQQGYNVAFVPFEGAAPSGEWSVFADGFKGADTLASPRDARYRPMALGQGPDGALYIGDSMQGRVWRVVYTGAAAEE